MSAITWIASYPKSGNTWTRALLAQYALDRRIASLEELEREAPDLTNLTNAGQLPSTAGDRPLFIKTHFLPDVSLLGEFADSTAHAIYLVRDPRDVIRSAARHLNIDESKYQQFAEQFLACEGVPDWVLAGWGTWPQSLAAWTSAERVASVFPRARLLVLRYEDLWADTVSTLRRIVAFLGLNDAGDPERLDRAVSNSTLERLRQAEQASESTGLRAFRDPPRHPLIGTGQRGQRLSGIGEHVEAAYKNLLAQDGDFARYARQFGYAD
jgi:hypothetical protein